MALSAPCLQTWDPSALYSAFLDKQEACESHARSRRIIFLDLLFENGGSAPVLASYGYCEHFADYEKWVRWEASLSLLTSQRGLSEIRYDSIRDALRSGTPIVDSSDGSRALSLQPYRGHDLLWYGLLQGEMDRRMRRGALNCGLMFSERWLSDHLRSFDLVSAERQDTEHIRFELKHSKSPKDKLLILTDNDYILSTIEWRKSGQPVTSATIQTHTTVDSLPLVSKATIVYEYAIRAVHEVSLFYEPSQLHNAPPLLELPPEISSLGGAALITDKLTGAEYPLGNPEILAQLQIHQHGSSPELPPASRRHNLLIGSGAVVLLVFAFLARRRHLKTPTRLHGILLLTPCLILLGCSDSELPPREAHAASSHLIQVLPSTHQSIRSSDRGETVTISYDIHNNSTIDYALSVGSKSCDCIGVSFSTPSVSSGCSSQIALVSTIPPAGQTTGSTIIQLTPFSASEQASHSTSIHLSYEIHAVLEPGLHVAPASLQVGSDAPPGTRTLTLICNTPSEPTGAWASWHGRTLDMKPLSSWQLSTEWSALYDLCLPSGAECSEYNSPLELVVVTAGDDTYTAHVDIVVQ